MNLWPVLRKPWVWQMAWRDSRQSRKRLVLALSSVTAGIAALVAITSFEANVRAAIQDQAKALLGADLVVVSHRPFPAPTETLIRSLGGRQSREVSCSSMAYFPKGGQTRLVSIRALDGDFPYYGRLITEPRRAAQTFQTGLYAVVDESVMVQFGVELGDRVRLGRLSYEIIGRLKRFPGGTRASAFVGPRIYIPLTSLARTGLVQTGSRLHYRVYFAFPEAADSAQIAADIEPHVSQHHLELDTVKKRTDSLGRVMENLTRFLNLIGVIALLLGGVGVASAMQVYVKHKRDTIAIVRCLGGRSAQVFGVYVVQALGLGLAGAGLGVGLGLAVQALLPVVLADFLPVQMRFHIAWAAVGQGVGVGLGTTLLFALLPLLSVRRVSPLRLLRVATDGDGSGRREPGWWLVVGGIVVGLSLFAVGHTARWTHGLGFVAGLGLAGGLLAGVAELIMVGLRRSYPAWWPYVWRQGLANLYRPDNQTRVLILALGLGSLLIVVLYLSQHMLLSQVALADSGRQPNVLMFDIQTDQRENVIELVRSFGLPVLEQAPIVTMRLSSVGGRPVAALRKDPEYEAAEWALVHEYRASYRDHLTETETLVAGVWQGRVASAEASLPSLGAAPGNGPVPVSLEAEIAQTLGVGLGDELVFDVQGVPIVTTVGSLRKVNWQRVQTNFFVVFPAGVLEDAPQVFALLSRVESRTRSAELQRAVVRRFPTVSAIDLSLVLQTVDAMLDKIAFATRFMAFFSLVAGLIVLAGAVINGRYQRLRESVLLRTLGASRRQIRSILLVEYTVLGACAAGSGIGLAVVSSWALAYYLFETLFAPAVLPLLGSFGLIVGLTIGVGLLGSRGMCDRPPLEALRAAE